MQGAPPQRGHHHLISTLGGYSGVLPSLPQPPCVADQVIPTPLRLTATPVLQNMTQLQGLSQKQQDWSLCLKSCLLKNPMFQRSLPSDLSAVLNLSCLVSTRSTSACTVPSSAGLKSSARPWSPACPCPALPGAALRSPSGRSQPWAGTAPWSPCLCFSYDRLPDAAGQVLLSFPPPPGTMHIPPECH